MVDGFCIRGKHPRRFADCYEARGYLPPLEYPIESQGEPEIPAAPYPHLQLQIDKLKAELIYERNKWNEHLDKSKKVRKSAF